MTIDEDDRKALREQDEHEAAIAAAERRGRIEGLREAKDIIERRSFYTVVDVGLAQFDIETRAIEIEKEARK